MGNHDEQFYSLNPKLGLAYEWADHDIAYVNLSRSFQPPSFDESLAVTSTGQMFNSLEAQKAWTIEIGSRGDLGPLTLGCGALPHLAERRAFEFEQRPRSAARHGKRAENDASRR